MDIDTIQRIRHEREERLNMPAQRLARCEFAVTGDRRKHSDFYSRTRLNDKPWAVSSPFPFHFFYPPCADSANVKGQAPVRVVSE